MKNYALFTGLLSNSDWWASPSGLWSSWHRVRVAVDRELVGELEPVLNFLRAH